MSGTHSSQELVVANLFSEIDLDDSGELTKREFRRLLSSLDINYSNDKFNRLFRTIDINRDGGINQVELCKTLYPELSFEKVEEAVKLLEVQNALI
jgi:Ca2+-binding EF-hand superfamily protein